MFLFEVTSCCLIPYYIKYILKVNLHMRSTIKYVEQYEHSPHIYACLTSRFYVMKHGFVCRYTFDYSIKVKS